MKRHTWPPSKPDYFGVYSEELDDIRARILDGVVVLNGFEVMPNATTINNMTRRDAIRLLRGAANILARIRRGHSPEDQDDD